MSDARFPVKMAGRVPVVETPEEIDITNAGQFREAATEVLRVFAISGLDRVLPCHSDLDRAVGRLSPHEPSVARCA